MAKKIVFRASEIAEVVGGKLYGENVEVFRISTDTRENFGKGTCFVAIDGEKYFGEQFISEAISKGASLIISKDKKIENVSCICVSDVREALLKIGAYNARESKIIAVTGSVGKTTVKEMIKSVFSAKYSVMATNENENNEIGVAKTLLKCSGEDYCIVEMGMRSRGEIDFMSSIVRPYISVITNCGTAHIGMLGSTENIFRAKTEIIKSTQKFVFVPSENRFKNFDFGRVIPVFIGKEGDYYPTEVSLNQNGISFYVNENNNDKFFIPSFSFHNAMNSVYAIAVGRLCGIENELIKGSLLYFSNTKMRQEIISINRTEIINDCYNASYESMKSALSSLVNYANKKGKRPFALLGDMLELGDASSEYHFRIGEYARDIHVEDVFSCGDFAEKICDGFLGGKTFATYDSVAKYIVGNLGENDVLLVKASRNMHFEKIINKMKEYSNGI